MLFNSYEFIFLFLPIAICGFFLLGKHFKHEWAIGWLVLASFFFYGWWDYHYVVLLALSIVFNYFVGKRIEQKQSKKWLMTGIVGNVAALGYYKYTDFFFSSINAAMGRECFTLLHIVLPLGISFFTFTQTAYLIDAYRRETKNRSFLTYCEFVTIFPHLIAGPIINHKTMIPQFVADKNFLVNYDNIAKGIAFFVFGLVKKVIIADSLAKGVNAAYEHAETLNFVDSWIASIGYTFQLYFDFSGYSEMAIGLALMLNLSFPLNFNSPYKACSIIDFWRRWHMTLGTWVKNYLYIPLGGNRKGEWRKSFNLFTSMLIIGIWHGAGWTYVLWGGLHGVCLLINHQWRRLGIALPKVVNWGLTFLTVNFLWVFFRADSIEKAWSMICTMVSIPAFDMIKLDRAMYTTRGEINILMIATVLLIILPNTQQILEHFTPNKKWLSLVVALAIASLWHFSNISDFLYFQF